MAGSIQDTIEVELEVWGVELFDALRAKLKEKKVEHSGQEIALMGDENIEIVLTFDDREASWIVNMKKYWKYLEYGTGAGGWMPDQKMDDWITLKGINPSTTLQRIQIQSLKKQGKSAANINPLPYDIALPRLRYILQRSIYKKGISQWQKKNFGKKSTDFISETLEPQVAILAKRLSEKLRKPILSVIKEEITKK